MFSVSPAETFTIAAVTPSGGPPTLLLLSLPLYLLYELDIWLIRSLIRR